MSDGRVDHEHVAGAERGDLAAAHRLSVGAADAARAREHVHERVELARPLEREVRAGLQRRVREHDRRVRVARTVHARRGHPR